MMKKTMLFCIIVIFLLSCSTDSDIIMDNNCNNCIDYKIVDTFNISENGFGKIMGYEIIIQIDSSYYSACLPMGDNNISRIYRKMNIPYKK